MSFLEVWKNKRDKWSDLYSLTLSYVFCKLSGDSAALFAHGSIQTYMITQHSLHCSSNQKPIFVVYVMRDPWLFWGRFFVDFWPKIVYSRETTKMLILKKTTEMLQRFRHNLALILILLRLSKHNLAGDSNSVRGFCPRVQSPELQYLLLC